MTTLRKLGLVRELKEYGFYDTFLFHSGEDLDYIKTLEYLDKKELHFISKELMQKFVNEHSDII